MARDAVRAAMRAVGRSVSTTSALLLFLSTVVVPIHLASDVSDDASGASAPAALDAPDTAADDGAGAGDGSSEALPGEPTDGGGVGPEPVPEPVPDEEGPSAGTSPVSVGLVPLAPEVLVGTTIEFAATVRLADDDPDAADVTDWRATVLGDERLRVIDVSGEGADCATDGDGAWSCVAAVGIDRPIDLTVVVRAAPAPGTAAVTLSHAVGPDGERASVVAEVEVVDGPAGVLAAALEVGPQAAVPITVSTTAFTQVGGTYSQLGVYVTVTDVADGQVGDGLRVRIALDQGDMVPSDSSVLTEQDTSGFTYTVTSSTITLSRAAPLADGQSATVWVTVDAAVRTVFEGANLYYPWGRGTLGVTAVATADPACILPFQCSGSAFAVQPYSWGGAPFQVSATPPASVPLDGSTTVTASVSGEAIGTFDIDVTAKESTVIGRAIGNETLDGQITLAGLSAQNTAVGSSPVACTEVTGGSQWRCTLFFAGSIGTPDAYVLSAIVEGDAAGRAGLEVAVTDGEGALVGRVTPTFAVLSGLAITTTSLSAATVGASYSASLAATGGAAPYAWAVTDGAVPDGLVLSSGGTISGTPTADAIDAPAFSVTVTDDSGATATATFVIAVAQPLVLTTATLPHGTVGIEYDAGFDASGGTTPYGWDVSAGTLPPGLVLDSEGGIRLVGQPDVVGSYTFTIRVTDEDGRVATREFTVHVAEALAITTTTLDPWAAGETGRSVTLSATGGRGSRTWSVTSGALPAGLTLSAAGTISGTTTALGTSSFSVGVTDADGRTAQGELDLTVADVTVVITPITDPIVDGGGALFAVEVTAVGGAVGPWSGDVVGVTRFEVLSVTGEGSMVCPTPTPPAGWTCGIDLLAQDEPERFVVEGRVTAPSPASLSVDWQSSGPAIARTTSEQVAFSTLDVVVAVSPATIPAGGTGTYTVTVTSVGGSSQSVFAELGSTGPLTLTSATASAGESAGECGPTANGFQCSLGDLAAGDSATITGGVTAGATGGAATVTATATPSGGSPRSGSGGGATVSPPAPPGGGGTPTDPAPDPVLDPVLDPILETSPDDVVLDEAPTEEVVTAVEASPDGSDSGDASGPTPTDDADDDASGVGLAVGPGLVLPVVGTLPPVVGVVTLALGTALSGLVASSSGLVLGGAGALASGAASGGSAGGLGVELPDADPNALFDEEDEEDDDQRGGDADGSGRDGPPEPPVGA